LHVPRVARDGTAAGDPGSQDELFGEIAVRKHTSFDAVMAEQAAVRDDWR